MPLSKGYACLKGRPIGNRIATSRKPHYQVHISANGVHYRIAINVQSNDGSEVEYLVRSHFLHPLTDSLSSLAQGRIEVGSAPGGIALDFIRGNLAQPWEFVPLPMTASGPDNDLNEKLDAYVQRAMSDEAAMIYAFGEPWGPEPQKADDYFGFLPGDGTHDIHMNQGNPPGPFASDNGPWQDGGLIFEFPNEQQWVAVFLKFQSQAWHSDDAGGGPIVPTDPAFPGQPHTPIDPNVIPPLSLPDGLVRIIAAYVNDVRTPEHETVTLLNTADVAVDLEGWMIADKQKNKMRLSGSIAPGATLVVSMVPPVALSNRGGIITLLNSQGIKVHGVSYTRSQASQPGRTIPFQS
jgi:uncharacterized protein YukJ